MPVFHRWTARGLLVLAITLTSFACEQTSSRASSKASPAPSPALTPSAAPTVAVPRGVPTPTYEVCSGSMGCESQRDAVYALGWSTDGRTFAYLVESDNRDMGLEYGVTLTIAGQTQGPWFHNGTDDTADWNIAHAWSAADFQQTLDAHSIRRGTGTREHEFPFKTATRSVRIEVRDGPVEGARLQREIVLLADGEETRLHQQEVDDLVAGQKPRLRYFASPTGDRIAVWADFPTGVIEGMVGRRQLVWVYPSE